MLWSDLIIGGDYERRHYMCRTLDDVTALAQAFAPVLKLENRPAGHEKKRFNLALEAVEKVGKSTFSNAMIDGNIKVVKEASYDQFIGLSKEFGQVVRADTHHMLGNSDIIYKTRNPFRLALRSMFSANGLDIVEHSIWSGRSDYHAVICIRHEWGVGEEARSFEVFASKIVQKMPAYQDFLKEVAPLSYTPKPALEI